MWPLTKQEEWLPDDVGMMRTINIVTEEFNAGENDAVVRVYIYWGTEDIKKGGVGRWDAEDLGELVWDDNFNLAPTKN